MTEKVKKNEPSFKLNYATVILLLVILIPAVYTIAVNFQKQEQTPAIAPAQTTASSTKVNDQNAAIEAALQIVNSNPSYDAYIHLGLTYYNVAKYQESIKAWEKALEFNPQGELAYNNIAAAYGSLGDFDAEIKICEKALSINPNLDIAKRNLEWAKSMKNKNK